MSANLVKRFFFIFLWGNSFFQHGVPLPARGSVAVESIIKYLSFHTLHTRHFYFSTHVIPQLVHQSFRTSFGILFTQSLHAPQPLGFAHNSMPTPVPPQFQITNFLFFTQICSSLTTFTLFFREFR